MDNVNTDTSGTGISFNKYQEKTRETAIYPKEKALEYTAFGLFSEAGEVAGKFKKMIRDKGGILDDEVKSAISDEIGDVLWYAARLSDELGISFETIAKNNLEKLFSRKDRGMIKGSGDKR